MTLRKNMSTPESREFWAWVRQFVEDNKHVKTYGLVVHPRYGDDIIDTGKMESQ